MKKPTATDVRPVAGYARLSVSTDESVSIAAQHDLLRRWAAAEGRDIILYTDDGYSGSKGIDRPAFDRMRAAIRDGEHALVVAKSIDRVSRRLSEFVNLADEVRIVAIESGVDTATASGRMMMSLLSVFAEHEARAMSERQTLSQAHRRQTGRATSGAGLGFVNVKREDGTYREIDPATADQVREIAMRVIAGDSLRRVSLDLNDAGRLSPRGNKWQASTVSQLLRNPSIAGMRKHLDDVERDSNGLPIVDDHLAILSMTEWLDLQAALDARAVDRLHGTATERLLLQGIAVCASCMRPLSKSTSTEGGKRVAKYACSGRVRKECASPSTIRASVLDNFIADQVAPLLDLPAVRYEIRADEQALQRRALIDAEINSLAVSLSSAPADAVVDIAERIADLRRQSDAVDIGESITRIETGETLRSWWSDDPRRVIDAAISQIEVRQGRAVGDRVEIRWTEDDHTSPD